MTTNYPTSVKATDPFSIALKGSVPFTLGRGRLDSRR